MQKFVVTPTAEGKFIVERWNDVTHQYEQIGITFSTRKLAELYKQDQERTFYEENKQ